MPYQNHPAIVAALQQTNDWIKIEGDNVPSPSVAREMIRVTRDGLKQPELACRIAALSLLLMKEELNTDNIAWIVRDGEIGFPEIPTFNFLKSVNRTI